MPCSAAGTAAGTSRQGQHPPPRAPGEVFPFGPGSERAVTTTCRALACGANLGLSSCGKTTNSFTAAEVQFAHPCYTGSVFPVRAFELGLLWAPETFPELEADARADIYACSRACTDAVSNFSLLLRGKHLPATSGAASGSRSNREQCSSPHAGHEPGLGRQLAAPLPSPPAPPVPHAQRPAAAGAPELSCCRTPRSSGTRICCYGGAYFKLTCCEQYPQQAPSQHFECLLCSGRGMEPGTLPRLVSLVALTEYLPPNIAAPGPCAEL